MKQQKQVVIELVKEALNKSFTPFVTVARDLLTKEQKNNIKNEIYNGIINGTIKYDKDKSDTKKIKTYASNVVSNYLRKEKLLNGNNNYKKSSSDKQLKELNKTLKQFDPGSAEYVEIKAQIKEREIQLKQKNKSSIGSPPQIDQTVLTPHLKEFVNDSIGE